MISVNMSPILSPFLSTFLVAGSSLLVAPSSTFLLTTGLLSPMISVNMSPILSPFSTSFLQSSLLRLYTATKQFWTTNLPNLLELRTSSLLARSSTMDCLCLMLEYFQIVSTVLEPCLPQARLTNSPLIAFTSPSLLFSPMVLLVMKMSVMWHPLGSPRRDASCDGVMDRRLRTTLIGLLKRRSCWRTKLP